MPFLYDSRRDIADCDRGARGAEGPGREADCPASGNITAIHVKMNDLRHNLERGLRTYAQAVEDGDTEKAERLARINDKHRKGLMKLQRCKFLQIRLYTSAM